MRETVLQKKENTQTIFVWNISIEKQIEITLQANKTMKIGWHKAEKSLVFLDSIKIKRDRLVPDSPVESKKYSQMQVPLKTVKIAAYWQLAPPEAQAAALTVVKMDLRKWLNCFESANAWIKRSISLKFLNLFRLVLLFSSIEFRMHFTSSATARKYKNEPIPRDVKHDT